MKSTPEFFAELRGLLLANADIGMHEQNLLGVVVHSLRNPRREQLLDLAVDFDRLESAAVVSRPELQTGLRWLSNVCASLADGSLPGEDRALLANKHSAASKILRHLEQSPGANSGDIANTLGLRPNHASNELKRLKQRRLIERLGTDNVPEGEKVDKRLKRYFLTASGNALLLQSSPAARAVETAPRIKPITLDSARGRLHDAIPEHWLEAKSTVNANVKVSRAPVSYAES
jgi:Mn-dependent DtxR family transcriptional regulator